MRLRMEIQIVLAIAALGGAAGAIRLAMAPSADAGPRSEDADSPLAARALGSTAARDRRVLASARGAQDSALTGGAMGRSARASAEDASTRSGQRAAAAPSGTTHRSDADAFDPSSLDRATPAVVLEALERAVASARAERELLVAPETLAAAAETGPVRVVFGATTSRDGAALATVLDPNRDAAAALDLRVFPLLGQAAATLSPSALYRLIADTTTASIELDAPHAPSLQASVPQIGADEAHVDGHDGDDFAVAVIDTGVDLAHPMFVGRVIEEACFSVLGDCPNAATQMLGAGAAAPCANPGCDHGTHVAGIALGDDDPGPVVGVAPRAELIAINVFSDEDGEALAYTSDILAAMQHVLALETFHDVAAINLSLGGQVYNSNQSCAQASPSLLGAVNQLRAAGILTVAASGNEEFTNAIASPACLANVISVGSVGDGDVVSTFSNSASFLTLLAPGETIQSAAVGGGLRSGSGTSMATPHVAGAIAAIREAVPDATPDEIQNALTLSGDAITDARNGVTRPRIRVDAAIALLQAAPANSGGGDPDDGGDSGGGGGGGCGLVGIEPFLVLPLVRLARRRRPRSRAAIG